MPDATTTVAELRAGMAGFVREREWEQFHSPKNLAMALAAEAAELMEHFLWIDNDASRVAMNDPGRRGEVDALQPHPELLDEARPQTIHHRRVDPAHQRHDHVHRRRSGLVADEDLVLGKQLSERLGGTGKRR